MSINIQSRPVYKRTKQSRVNDDNQAEILDLFVRTCKQIPVWQICIFRKQWMRTFLLEIPPGHIPYAAFLSVREVKSSAYFRNKPENFGQQGVGDFATVPEFPESFRKSKN